MRALENPSGACLATVVGTEGTAPRKEGSKMLVIGGKTLKGAVTVGGCVDAQVIEASAEVARSGVSQLLRMQLGEEDAFEIGLTCAGALRVLIEPVGMPAELAARMRSLVEKGTPFVLLTATRSTISSVSPSAKMIITSQGEAYGSLGDERVDRVMSNAGMDNLSKGICRPLGLNSALKFVDGTKDAALEVFVDVIGYRPDLFIFGAGQVAVPVARLAHAAGFRVHVVDSRPTFCNEDRFPTAGQVLVGFPGEIARGSKFNQFTFALLLAHAAKHDLPVLEVLLRSDARYIGVLGSAKRARALAKRLREMGFKKDEISRLHVPVGLDVGAETAEQMAVAVIGELLMVKSGTTGKSLKLVKGIASSV